MQQQHLKTNTNGGYIGGITVQVINIKPSPVPIGTAIPLQSGSNNNSNSAILGPTTTMNGKTPTDSVGIIIIQDIRKGNEQPMPTK